jgi:predicted nucleotidyltransferase
MILEQAKALLKKHNNQEWIQDLKYLVYHGSKAYGTDNENSDTDLYGFVIPPKEFINPFSDNFVYYFDDEFPKFEQTVAISDELDIQVYNVVKFFKLMMNGNPNMIDCLYVKPKDCIINNDILINNREVFLSQKIYHTFRGYAHAQRKKAYSLTKTGKRKDDVDKYGFDPKHCSHIYRLLDEVRQLLSYGTMDIHNSKQVQIDIKNAKFSIDEMEDLFNELEYEVEIAFRKTDLPKYPNKDLIRNLLKEVIECQ